MPSLDPSWTPSESPNVLFSERSWFAGIFITAVAYGAALTLAVQCFSLLLRSMNSSNYKKNLFWIIYVSLLFICATLYAAAGAKINELAFIDYHLYPGGPSAFEYDYFWLPVNAMGNVFFIIANWLSDAVVVWRCVIIYADSGYPRWVILAFPVLAYLASFTLSLMWLIQVCNPNYSLWVFKSVNFTTPFLYVSLAINIVMTLAIVSRLMMYRWRISRIMGKQYGNHYTNLVTMLIESTMLYAVFSMLSIIPFSLKHPIQNVFIQIVSTLMIIFRVASGQAWSSDTATSLFSSPSLTSEDAEMHGGHPKIQFVDPCTSTDTNGDSDSTLITLNRQKGDTNEKKPVHDENDDASGNA
ncbi:uncharacterized protein EV420DRAFT_1275960 [Desarmillaria tabescens]|uniref:Uncharacterized protein n=1 Tax=Armillaria tabescens TaxID=1929756 RepID=A0AA39JTY0_ARMTA|nr:uncharacterized protein EV420DRAFT_1275960 [Desarmillaria tabescens]KAK0447855.1 hypothetical protein EV420DRAFT_1275960 [Desarmillaria tabescens]